MSQRVATIFVSILMLLAAVTFSFTNNHCAGLTGQHVMLESIAGCCGVFYIYLVLIGLLCKATLMVASKFC